MFVDESEHVPAKIGWFCSDFKHKSNFFNVDVKPMRVTQEFDRNEERKHIRKYTAFISNLIFNVLYIIKLGF